MSNVEQPAHYALDGLGIEAIDVIKAQLGEGFASYVEGNILKYILRYKKKNGVEDLKKAKKYLEWLIETEEN